MRDGRRGCFAVLARRLDAVEGVDAAHGDDVQDEHHDERTRKVRRRLFLVVIVHRGTRRARGGLQAFLRPRSEGLGDFAEEFWLFHFLGRQGLDEGAELVSAVGVIFEHVE